MVPGHVARVSYLLNTTFFQVPRYRIQAQCRPVPKWKVETLCSGTKVGMGSLCAHRFFLFFRSGQFNALYSLPSSCFKMESDIAKWSISIQAPGKHGWLDSKRHAKTWARGLGKGIERWREKGSDRESAPPPFLSPVSSRFIFVFALSQFRWPDYFGA